MGIRFKCHACGHELHVKDFQAGKRSKCPACEIRFRIPQESTDFSLPIADQTESALSTSTDSTVAVATKTSSVPFANPQIAAKSTVETQPIPAPKPKTVPQAIQEAPDAAWFVQPPTGGQFGPAPANIFVEWLGENRVTRDSMVWREGWPEWQLASEAFADYFPGSQPVPNATKIEAPPLSNSQMVALSPTGNVSSDKTELETSASALSTVERTRLAKKMKRRRNYTLMILLLAMVAIGLVVALVVVLMRK